MAGKIALGILGSFLLVGFGYALCREHYKAEIEKQKEQCKVLPFKVARVVHEGDSEAVTATGMTAPFTVLIYESRPVKMTLPGDLGQLGEEIFLPDPRQSSASTTVP